MYTVLSHYSKHHCNWLSFVPKAVYDRPYSFASQTLIWFAQILYFYDMIIYQISRNVNK